MARSAGRSPLIGGEKGWADPRSTFTETGDWDTRFRLWPACFRVFAREDPENFPELPEKEIVRSVDALFSREAIRRDRRITRAPDFRAHTQRLLDYLLSDEGSRMESWWRRTKWKSPVRLSGYRELLSRHLWNIDISMWELAHFKIPARLEFDTDVIMFLAFCQGLDTRDYNTLVGHGERKEQMSVDARQAGASKLFADPWFVFSLVAPFLSQYGIFFPGSSIFESIARMEVILSNPYIATHRELDCIMSQPMYHTAHARMVSERRRRAASHVPTPIQPLGRWFFNGLARGRRKTLAEHCLWQPSFLRPEPETSPFIKRTFDAE